MDDEFINLFSSCTRRLSSRRHRIFNHFTKRTCVPGRLVYASVTNKLSYFIKCLLPAVFVRLRRASMEPGNSLHTLPSPSALEG